MSTSSSLGLTVPTPDAAPEPPARPRRRWWPWALLTMLLLAAGGAAWVLAGLPPRESVRSLASKAPERTRLMQQRVDEAKQAGRRYRIDHRPVRLGAVSRELLVAVIAAEDARFFEHEGFDWEAMREAARINWERGRLSHGASTLSQQLVKNLFFSTRRSAVRKLREAIVTHWLEQDLEKRRILELYMSSVEWGPGVFGCEAAARRWFGIACARLDPDQAAGLAAMLPNPRRINPETSPQSWARARDRVRRLMDLARGARRELDRRGLGNAVEPAPGPVAVHWKGEEEPPVFLRADPSKLKMPTAEQALPGRSEAMPVPERHFVSGAPLEPPFPSGLEEAIVGMGCFWGAERRFWEAPGVFTTAVGYAGGFTPHPTYREVCSGQTGHNEVVRVIFDPASLPYGDLLRLFWEGHDPTQGMRQGNDVGTQYRSGIYTFGPAQRRLAEASREAYQKALRDAGHGEPITTEIRDAPPFYYAEDYHQQYLAKNPGGYCGLGGTGVACPTGLVSA